MRERRIKAALVDRVLEGEASPEGGLRILDLGCGTGTLTVALARRAPSGSSVTGLDGDSDVLERARAKAQADDVEVELVRGLADSLPFPEGSFDRVVSSLVFHHAAGDQGPRARGVPARADR